MGAGSKLVLPGDFEAGKSYLLAGATLLAWRKALVADRVIPGPNLLENQGPDGRIFTAAAGVKAGWRILHFSGCMWTGRITCCKGGR